MEDFTGKEIKENDKGIAIVYGQNGYMLKECVITGFYNPRMGGQSEIFIEHDDGKSMAKKEQFYKYEEV